MPKGVYVRRLGNRSHAQQAGNFPYRRYPRQNNGGRSAPIQKSGRPGANERSEQKQTHEGGFKFMTEYLILPTAAQPVDNHSVSRRLQSELMLLMTCGDPGISAFPDGDNIFLWLRTIKGSKDTVYEGLSYKLRLKFPNEYPFKPPVIKFDTPCFHPNVDQYGNICLNILQDKWSSAYDVRTLLLSIQSLLGEPNNDSPLNNYAAALWSNQEEYKKVMHKQYRSAGRTIS